MLFIAVEKSGWDYIGIRQQVGNQKRIASGN